MTAWLVTRHIFYNLMLWSCIRYALSLQHSTRPVQENWAWGRNATWGLVGLLCILQCILFVWLTMIFKVAWKVLTGKGAEDNRSDEESNDEGDVVATRQADDSASIITPPLSPMPAQASMGMLKKRGR